MNTGRPLSFSLNETDRNDLEKDPVGFQRGWFSLKCHMGVWDEGVSPVAIEEDKTLLSQDRRNSCFFIKHKPSMLCPAAVELQKRSQENSNLKKSFKFTIIGLWIAVFGLILNLVVAIINNFANQRVDPTVKTPVESGKVQGTASHP